MTPAALTTLFEFVAKVLGLELSIERDPEFPGYGADPSLRGHSCWTAFFKRVPSQMPAITFENPYLPKGYVPEDYVMYDAFFDATGELEEITFADSQTPQPWRNAVDAEIGAALRKAGCELRLRA